MKAKVFLFVILFVALLIYAPALAEKEFPSRIISLGPALTEELYLLGAQDKLVGCTVYCQKPPEARNKEKIGAVIEINLERIIALQPDLVLATSLTDAKAKEKLKNLGIKVVTFPAAENFNAICRQFLELGILIGKEKEANEIMESAKSRVDSIKKKFSDTPRPRVFIQMGARPLVTMGADSFVNDFIEFAGGINITQGIKTVLYSREKVVKDNPDVIIIATMGINGEKEKESWRRYSSLKAVRNNRIYIVDSSLFCSPTPLSFVETLEEIIKILHP